MEKRSAGFDQFDKAYDFKCDTEARTYYTICSTPRSGSHFLGHLMYATGAMGYPLEYFLEEHFQHWEALSGRRSAIEVIDYIKSRRTSSNGCFGLKADFPQFVHAFRDFAFDAIFPKCRFLLIHRDDLLGQAISFVRAKQTGQWISMQEPRATTRYDFDAIERAMMYLLKEEASWMRFFALSGREYFRVRYESLVENPVAVIDGIASYLHVGPVQIQFESVLPKKQADAESEQWRRRFLDDAEALSVEHVFRRLSLRLL